MSLGGPSNLSNYLKAAASVEAGFQYDDDPKSSAFHKSGYYTTTPHIGARYLIKPNTQLSDYSNNNAIYRISRDHDFGGLADLQIPVSAMTSAGNPSYLRGCDWLGFCVIREVQIKHNTHALQMWQGDSMLPHYLLESTPQSRQMWDGLVLGNMSPTARNMAARDVQVAHVPLDLWAWWSKNSHCYLNSQSYSDEIQVVVYYHPKSEWVQTDVTSPEPVVTLANSVTIRGQTFFHGMVLEEHFVTEAERTYHHNMILNEGTLEPFADYTNVGRATIDPNQNNVFSVEMKNLNMPVRHVAVIVRRTTDLDTAYSKDHSQFLTLTGIGMTGQSSGGEFVPFSPDRYLRQRIQDQYHSSVSEEAYPIYFWSWTFTPEDHINELGSLHFGNITNPQLNCYIGTNIGDSEARDVSRGNYPFQTSGEQLAVDIYAQTFNMKQEFGGTPKRTFG